jgi:hypothetical protein
MEKLFTKHRKLLSNLPTAFKNSMYYNFPWQEQLTGITGARGVGKTTMMLQYIGEEYGYNKSALYISFDSIAFQFASLYELADEFVKQGGRHLFIDEIHKYPTWSVELKEIFDTFSELKITFSGSSILEIHKGKADLSRRALVFEMNGLSFREFLQIRFKMEIPGYPLSEILNRHEEISINICKNIKPFEFFPDYLKFGYYPYFLQSEDFYSMRLSNTINQIIETDMPLLLNIERLHINKLKRFVNILAADTPQTPNISALASAIEVSWKTIVKYINYLQRAKIINILEYSGKNVTVLSKPDKIYLHHPNLFYVFKDEIGNKGGLREAFFVNQLANKHKIELAKRGDFIIDNKYTFEIGGKNKRYHQIAGIEQSYLAADDIETGFGNKIPLWLFGFLY